MSYVDKQKREFHEPYEMDKIGVMTYEKVKKIGYDVVGQVAKFAVKKWPGDWPNYYRNFNWIGTYSNFRDENNNLKPEGYLNIGNSTWVKPPRERPYVRYEYYSLIAYGHLRSHPNLKSFVFDGWSGCGGSGPRNSDLSRQGFLQMLDQLQQDPPLVGRNEHLEKMHGHEMYPEYFGPGGEAIYPSKIGETTEAVKSVDQKKHWSERIEEEKRQKSTGEEAEKAKQDTLKKAIEFSISQLRYDPYEELARLGNLTGGWTRSMTRDNVDFWIERIKRKDETLSREAWQGILRISNSREETAYFKKYKVKENYFLSAIGLVDPVNPDNFTLTKWMGWGAAPEGRTAGLSEAEFGDLLYQLHNDGPKTERTRVIDYDAILLPKAEPQPPGPGIVIVRPSHRIGGLWSQVKPDSYDGGM